MRSDFGGTAVLSSGASLLGERIPFDLAAAETFEGRHGGASLSLATLFEWAFAGLWAAEASAPAGRTWALQGVAFGAPLALAEGEVLATQTLVAPVAGGRQVRCFGRVASNPDAPWTELVSLRCGCDVA